MNKKTFDLWNNVPGMCEEVPKITYYKAENRSTDGAVVIFPGGGYTGRAAHEGEGYALFLNSFGIDAFVVDYRVYPHKFPIELLDARRGVRFVRYNAEKFGINPNKIAVMGSSAGGHLAAMESTYRKELELEHTDEVDSADYIPNYQVLAYPVVAFSDLSCVHCGSVRSCLGADQLNIAPSIDPIITADEKTPPAFIWHTSDDNVVNVKNSLLYGARLRDMNVPFEMHIFPHGNHGLGIAEDNKYINRWTDFLIKWFENIGFIEK